MRTFVLFIAVFFSFQSKLDAQAPQEPTSAEIYDNLLKLNVLGSVLYVGAHPDDENTRMISYFSNEKKYETTYLSLTRGDGGQNLIGPEIRELLGVIRTQELLAARRLDGGHQLFSRANDFGYSKHPDETMNIWNTKEVMADAVWAIRRVQPDVIINRFDYKSAGKTHGHHTASALIGFKAFDEAADKTAYPSQLKYVQTWQAQRLFFNTSWWFYGSREKFAEADKSDMVQVDVGVYYPLIGKSNTEIAAESRSMHQCQGMGNTGYRGSSKEYLEILKGDLPKNSNDPFIGINTTWSRIKGGEPIGKMVEDAIANFKYNNPAASVPALVDILKKIEALPDGNWKKIKFAACIDLIKNCSGLYIETVAQSASVTPGGKVECDVEIVQRLGAPMTLERLELVPNYYEGTINMELKVNEVDKRSFSFDVPNDFKYSSPYWLEEKATLGMYGVKDQLMRGIPENPAAFSMRYHFKVQGHAVVFESPVVYKWNDAVTGEKYDPFVVTPEFSISLEEKVIVFSDQPSKTIHVKVKALGDQLKGTVRFNTEEGWSVAPEKLGFELGQKGQSKTLEFEVFPPKEQSVGSVEAIIDVNNKIYNQELVEIDYDHIPKQTVLVPATAKLVKVDLKKRGDTIGYIMGAGDDIPANLEQIGYRVELVSPENLNAANLAKYDAVILGIRAFNTQKPLKFGRDALMEYVKQGGNLIVQYNTNRRLVTEDIAPYKLKLSRARVAVEGAEVRFLAKDNPVLNSPNKITQKDFEGWVQERGLYFASEWDDRFTPILSANDPGEEPRDGGLLIAPYGKGNYVYTGYSWFRELPAGVPGAYRIFANIISLKSNSRP